VPQGERDPPPDLSVAAFAGHAQQLVVQLRSEKERWYQCQACRSRSTRPPGLLVVQDDHRGRCTGSYFDGQGDRLPLAGAQPSSGHEYGWLAGRCLYRDPRWKDRNRRRDLASDSRRNENGLEKSWNQVESLYACKRDRRAGVRYDRHSKLLEGVELPLELFAYLASLNRGWRFCRTPSSSV
jgi:hypothetical protein